MNNTTNSKNIETMLSLNIDKNKISDLIAQLDDAGFLVKGCEYSYQNYPHDENFGLEIYKPVEVGFFYNKRVKLIELGALVSNSIDTKTDLINLQFNKYSVPDKYTKDQNLLTNFIRTYK